MMHINANGQFSMLPRACDEACDRGHAARHAIAVVFELYEQWLMWVVVKTFS